MVHDIADAKTNALRKIKASATAIVEDSPCSFRSKLA
jgi:hypothetical protein